MLGELIARDHPGCVGVDEEVLFCSPPANLRSIRRCLFGAQQFVNCLLCTSMAVHMSSKLTRTVKFLHFGDFLQMKTVLNRLR
jgi:hypothetical protein